jgi:hypothetical protein
MFKQTLLAFAALAFGSTGAIAAPQLHIIASPSATSEASSIQASVAPNLHAIFADFGALPPASSSDWPCFGGDSECSSIASGGLVIGAPAFTWSLVNCDAKAKRDTAPCGQLFWTYADNTNDTTDELIFSVVVTQGTNHILDITDDYGPNPFGSSVVSVFAELAFGTIGNHTGPGNGWCSVETVTCVNPHAGLANVAITTTVGMYSITQRFQINLQ